MTNYYKPQPGDKIRAHGVTITIAEIITEDWTDPKRWADGGYMVEFKDPKGHYHYWKQYCDGGELIKAGEKKDHPLSYSERLDAYSIVSQMIHLYHDRNPYADTRFPEPEMIKSIDEMIRALEKGDFSEYIPYLEEAKSDAIEEKDDDALTFVSFLLEDIHDFIDLYKSARR